MRYCCLSVYGVGILNYGPLPPSRQQQGSRRENKDDTTYKNKDVILRERYRL
jgi:hypothetical protein